MNLQTITSFIVEHVTFDNIVAALALIGSAGTAWSFISSRKRLHIQISNIVYRT